MEIKTAVFKTVKPDANNAVGKVNKGYLVLNDMATNNLIKTIKFVVSFVFHFVFFDKC
jgi:hypothetical protein